MIERVLQNLSYVYYPKGIDGISQREEYIASKEYLLLSSTLNNFMQEEVSKMIFDKLVKSLKGKPAFATLVDNSVPTWQDRCLTYSVMSVEGNILTQIFIHISLLIPCYVVYVTDNRIKLNPYRWVGQPKRNRKKEQTLFKEHLYLLTQVLEKELGYAPFPEKLAKRIIPDINFHDINIGEFTFFNAFFLNHNIY